MRFNRVSICWVILLSGIISAAVICLPFSAMGDQNLGEAVKQAFNKKVTGDFDKMVENRIIRAPVPYSKTFYFLDGATPKGAEYEMLKLFEKQLNKQLSKEGKLPVKIVEANEYLEDEDLLEVVNAG